MSCIIVITLQLYVPELCTRAVRIQGVFSDQSRFAGVHPHVTSKLPISEETTKMK